MMNPVVRLARWLRNQVVQYVPENIAVCEFECLETTCTSAKWNECRRRREMTPGGATQGTDQVTRIRGSRNMAGPSLPRSIAS
jgi:hypothetical protein